MIPTLRAAAALVMLALAARAAAEPLPETRIHGAASVPGRAALPAWLGPAPDPGERLPCPSGPEAAREALRLHQSRATLEPLPTPNSRDVGEIAVLEDDGTFFFTDGAGHVILDVAAAAQAFYRTHGDDHDGLALYLASGLNTWLGSPGALAASFVVRNDTEGIGLAPFDLGAAYGSPARLSNVMSMNGLHRYSADPFQDDGWGLTSIEVLGHEFAHRWLAYTYVDSAGTATPAILGRAEAHWDFFGDVAGSIMDGCDWVQVTPDSFRTVGRYQRFFPLDQYLMGLRGPAEVDSFFDIDDWYGANPPAAYVPASSPIVGLGLRGRATWWDVDDVVRANGPRLPDAASAPRGFRVAVALVVPRGSAASAADLAKLDTLRTRFAPWWESATDGRSTMDVSLDSRAGRVTFAHQPLPDAEDPAAPRLVSARVTVEGGGLPLAIVSASVRMRWRPQGAGAWNELALAPAGTDTYAAALPGPGAAGTYEYVLAAATDSAGIDGTDPAAGEGAPHVFTLGPDTTPPAVVHAPVRSSAPAQMPRTLLARVTDNVAVAAVWAEVAVEGGAPVTLPAAAVGRDSFAVAVGAGLAEGQRIAYRFVARDAALAGNLALAGAAPETLAVGAGWAEEWENGAAGWTHAALTPTWRDVWRLSRTWSAPAGGTGWRCGLEGGAAYPARLDAGLVSPEIPALAPGTVLRFDHRFDLEQANATRAWDAARVEGSVAGGSWIPLEPVAGYTHTTVFGTPLGAGAPCWSGRSSGFQSVAVDLTPLVPGPARVRFRMVADDYLGAGGWDLDRLRIDPPVGPPAAVPRTAVAPVVGRAWPNPARAALRVSLALPRAARAEWALYDVGGRRVAALASAALAAGAHELRGSVTGLLPGLYLARLALDGRAVRVDRVAVVR